MNSEEGSISPNTADTYSIFFLSCYNKSSLIVPTCFLTEQIKNLEDLLNVNVPICLDFFCKMFTSVLRISFFVISIVKKN